MSSSTLAIDLLTTIEETSDFFGGSDCKTSAHSTGNPSSIPGSGGSPEKGKSNPLQYACLENPIDGGSW